MSLTFNTLQTAEELVRWDAFVAHSAGGFFSQMSAWGRVKEQFGWRPWVLTALENDQIVAGIQVLTKRLPLGQQLFYVPYGPVEDQLDGETALALIHELQRRCQSGVALMVEPGMAIDTEAGQSFIATLNEAGFKPDGHMQQPEETLILDLSQAEDQLLANMRQTTRRYIRQTQRAGLVAEEDSRLERLEDFYAVLDQVNTRKKFGIHTLPYYRAVFEAFGEQAHLFFVRREHTLLGAYFVIQVGNKSWELYGGVTEAGQQAKASYLLKWTSILKMREHGVVAYDQWGIASAEAGQDHPLSGVTYFKEGYGGKRVAWLGSWTWSSRPWLHRLATLSGKL